MRRRRPSLRLRLTLSYGLLFFVVAVVMLGLTYFLFQQHALVDTSKASARIVQGLGYPKDYLQQLMPTAGGKHQTVGAFLGDVEREALNAAPRFIGSSTFVVLAVATLISVAAGWWLAGRMLRPINEISMVARRLSASTLHERIALEGPHDELRDLADTFDAMLVRLEAAFISQRDFVADASHELRTPLAIVRAELDVTLADPEVDAEELRRMAGTIREAIARSEDVIDRLLLLAESEDLAEHEPVDLAQVVRGVAAQYERRAQDRRLELRLTLEPAVVVGEAALLERLVDNLLSNCVRYAPENTGVSVEARPAGDWALLTVANGGEVIPEPELPQLFERFYRRERSRNRHEGGSGLGLAIVAAIAEAHGGTIEATAPPTGGLTMTVRLPAQRRDARTGRS